MDGIGKAGMVLDDAVAVYRRHNYTGNVVLCQFGLEGFQGGLSFIGRYIADLYAVELGIGLHHLDHMGQQGPGQEHTVLLAGAGDGHLHGFRGGGGAVVHGSIGDVQPR